MALFLIAPVQMENKVNVILFVWLFSSYSADCGTVVVQHLGLKKFNSKKVKQHSRHKASHRSAGDLETSRIVALEDQDWTLLTDQCHASVPDTKWLQRSTRIPQRNSNTYTTHMNYTNNYKETQNYNNIY